MEKKITTKKLLFISYYLPPTKTVAAVRLFNFHHEAAQYFSAIHCITTSNRQLFSHEKTRFDDSETHEIWTFDLRRLLTKKSNHSTGINQASKNSYFSKFLSKLSYSFPFNIFLADGGLTYILGGYFKGKDLIKKQKIEFLFSSYKPYSDHLICFLLKKWNPKLVWIADFRDLHVDQIRKNIFFPSLQKWFNKKILHQADIVTTVSNGLASQMKKYHHNVSVLRNGISTITPPSVSNSHFEKFTISYTGSIYPEFQSATLLLRALQKLIIEKKINEQKVHLIYAGKEFGVWDEWITNFDLGKINTTHHFLSQNEAQKIQHKSHVNLLLSWASEKQQGILTAKFYEYLLARNPILLIIKGSKDQEFESIFQQIQEGEIVYDNPKNLAKMEAFILKKYHDWEKDKSVARISEDVLNDFKWDKQMEAFLKSNHLI